MIVATGLREASFAMFVTAVTFLPTAASAITVEVAKKCNALVATQFPPLEPGNPAAGSSKGSAQAEREYFTKCVANGGTMNDATVDSSKKKTAK